MKNFESNILTLYGEKGKTWLAQLPNKVQKLKAYWGLSSLQPLTNLTFHYVLEGFQGEKPIILKIGPDSLEREAKALEVFKGYGAVALLDKNDQALLLEKAQPGSSLKGHPKKIEVACQVIERLHQAPLPNERDFPSIESQLKILDKEWPLPKELLQKARILKEDLLTNITMPRVFLHGDLHLDNILSAGEGWLVIDPKGVLGFSINEVWACIEDLEHDINYISHYFNYPLREVAQWYYIHSMVAACWQIEDGLDPTRFLEFAKRIIHFF